MKYGACSVTYIPVLLRKPWKQRRGLFRKADSPAALYLVTVQPKPGKVLRKLLGEFGVCPSSHRFLRVRMKFPLFFLQL